MNILLCCHGLNFNNDLPWLNNLSDIVSILGITAVIIAITEYKGKSKKEKIEKLQERLNAIKSIKYQLEVIGRWTSFESGGYKKHQRDGWINREIKRAQIINAVFKIENNFLSNISLMPGYYGLDDKIHLQVSCVSQWVCSFNSQLEEIRSFKYSISFDKYIQIDRKLLNEDKTKLSQNEIYFVDRLMKMIDMLHFHIIGEDDENAPTLHFWHKQLKNSLDKLEKNVRNELKLIL